MGLCISTDYINVYNGFIMYIFIDIFVYVFMCVYIFYIYIFEERLRGIAQEIYTYI